MTQTVFAPPPVVAPEAEEQTGGTSRRTLLVAGGLVAALALGGGGYVLLSGGSDDLSSAPPVQHFGVTKTTKAQTPTKAVTPVKKTAVKVPVTSTVPLGRDPFHALYVPSVAAPATSVATGTNTTPATTTTGGSTTTPTTTNPGPARPTTYKLSLTKVTGSGKDLTATFTVGGKLMVAKVGTVFGPTGELKLLSLGQNSKGVWVATIQVGDSEPVDAPKGATLYVA
jgi:hypothetical protein